MMRVVRLAAFVALSANVVSWLTPIARRPTW